MDQDDRLAIATLAASRCAALGTIEAADYVAAYATMEAEFKALRQKQAQQEKARSMETWEKLS